MREDVTYVTSSLFGLDLAQPQIANGPWSCISTRLLFEILNLLYLHNDIKQLPLLFIKHICGTNDESSNIDILNDVIIL